MGCKFEFTVIADNQDEGYEFIMTAKNEIERIEKITSFWDENSETTAINENAGVKPVKVSIELFDLISRSIEISRITEGAFDPTYASMDKIWKFDGSMSLMPSEKEMALSIAKVGYEKVVLNQHDSTIFLPEKGMKLGLGGIGKGYAADKAKELLISKGVKAGVINASGDMTVWGLDKDNSEWKVAITNPLDKKNVYALLNIHEGAVVTSSNYEKFVELNGEKYTHIINPKTGYPAQGIASVTVFAPKAELADALATSVFVMGIEAGLDLINQMPKTECVAICQDGTIHQSINIKIDNR
ncbi:FAD:protein FMN transferase [Aureibacter tunicatorum]|nr:FAD:protein FMN transferase [Aureibacter tunicatorum]